MIKTISILGCGWLGLPLALKFVALGYAVKGSTTSAGKIALLKDSSIVPYQFVCSQKSIDGNNTADFFSSENLFVNLPFRRDLADPFDYARQMQVIFSQSKTAGVKKLIMASSTAVYPTNNKTVKENEKITPDNERSRALLEAEDVFLKQTEICASVVRLAGLYGPGREIGSFLKDDRMLAKDGDAPVNLVHLDDCIGVITTLFEKSYCGEIFNVCADAHPLRKDLYAHVAVAMKVKQPILKEHENPRYKIVSNDKVKDFLGYRFIHPSPWEWIDQNQVLRNGQRFQREV